MPSVPTDMMEDSASEEEPAAIGAVSAEAAAHLALRIGRGLLTDGADAIEVRRTVERVAEALGHEAHALVDAEAVLVTVEGRSGFRTKLGRAVPAMAVDMDRLIRIGRVADAAIGGCRDVAELDARLDAIEQARAGHSLAIVTAGMALTAGCLARLFGADWPVVAAASLAGAVGTLLRHALARPAFNAVGATFVTALVSGLAGALAMRLAPDQSPVLCLTAAGMVLVPGVPLINGVRDLVDGHTGVAIARLAQAAVTLLAIGFALYCAALVAGDVLPVGTGPGRVPVAEDILFSGLGAIGYAALFNVPLRAFWACMLCAVAGHGLRTAFESGGLDLATASLVAAGTGGVAARLFAASWRVPAVVFGFPGVVAMMPGSYAFRAAIGVLQIAERGASASTTLIAETLSLTLTTMLVTAAIAIGLSVAFAMPMTFLQRHPRRKP